MHIRERNSERSDSSFDAVTAPIPFCAVINIIGGEKVINQFYVALIEEFVVGAKYQGFQTRDRRCPER